MVLKVLLVDDEPVFRDYIRQMDFWNAQNYMLIGESCSADQAIQFLEFHETDIVITDISMPGKNGVMLTEYLMNNLPSTAIIAVSSFDDYDYVRDVLRNGANDYILKSRLSEELLFVTLENIRTQLKGRTPWETKKELRRMAKSWLLEDGINPFTSDNSRKTITIIKIGVADEYAIHHMNERMDGISKIIESVTSENMDVLTCFRDQKHVIVLTRFYGLVSEADMKNQLECNRIVIQDNIRKTYNLIVSVIQCPFFFSDHTLRKFLVHKLKEQQIPLEHNITLSLTINQYKRLLSAAEDHNAEKAEQIVSEIYETIPEDQEGASIMITKELLELIERISIEYQIRLDFIPREFMLIQYTRVKRREILVSTIAGIYKNVLREIREMSQMKMKYSNVVKDAINYQNENYHRPIGLRMIAKEIGVSNSYLSRIFREETGVTVTDYLNNIRIGHASKLIESEAPLKEIFSSCGFRSYGYFLRTFKEYTGMTPKEYLMKKQNCD